MSAPVLRTSSTEENKTGPLAMSLTQHRHQHMTLLPAINWKHQLGHVLLS